jgi:hypothetical protein
MVAKQLQGSMANFRNQYGAVSVDQGKTGLTYRQRKQLMEQDLHVQKNMSTAFSAVIFEVVHCQYSQKKGLSL